MQVFLVFNLVFPKTAATNTTFVIYSYKVYKKEIIINLLSIK